MPGYLQELLPAEPALMDELFHLFLEDATVSMYELTEQTRLADELEIARTLHTLKGSCSQMGGDAMSQILEEMEERLRGRGIEAVSELLPALRAAFQALRSGIEDWMLKATDDPSRD